MLPLSAIVSYLRQAAMRTHFLCVRKFHRHQLQTELFCFWPETLKVHRLCTSILSRNVLDLLKVESHQSHSESLGPRWELIQCVRSQRWYEEFMVSVHRD